MQLQQSLVPHAIILPIGEDQVIIYHEVEQRRCIPQLVGHLDIQRTWIDGSGRVIMRQCDAGSPACQGKAQYLFDVYGSKIIASLSNLPFFN